MRDLPWALRLYLAGYIITFVILTVEDAILGARAFFIGLAFNPFIAMAWPAYWLLLRWIM